MNEEDVGLTAPPDAGTETEEEPVSERGRPARLLIDAHEDIAWNVLCYRRDYSLSAHEIRKRETNAPYLYDTGSAMLGLPDWRRAGVAVVFGTIFTMPERRAKDPFSKFYRSSEEAYERGMESLAIYRKLGGEKGIFDIITARSGLDAVIDAWRDPELEPRIGLVLAMENGDPIRDPAQLEEWYEEGLRLVGPAWVGSRYCGGTHEPGPLTAEGFELLRRMGSLSMALDLAHMTDEGFMQALDVYGGPVLASHANPRSMVPGERQLSDTMIHALIEHDGIVGIAPINRFLVSAWDPESGLPVELTRVALAIDHVCQLAGSTRHVGLGTDFDGGFGAEMTPDGIDTIGDLPRVGDALIARGYGQGDLEAIFSGNWLRLLRRCLPD